MFSLPSSRTVKCLVLAAGLVAVVIPPALSLGQGLTPSATEPAATAPKPPDPVLATINGREVNREKFIELLMQVAGMRVFDQVLSLELAQRACFDAGITITNKDLNAARERIFDEFRAQNVPEGQLNNVLARSLQSRGVTEVEYQIGLTLNAYLHRLAEGKAPVTEKDLDDFIKADYGEKRRVIDILVHDLVNGQKVIDAIQAKAATGTPIEEAVIAVAQEKGLQANQIVIPKEGNLDTTANPGLKLLKEIKDKAFERKVHEFTAPFPFVGDDKHVTYHLLFLDSIIPARPEPVGAAARTKVKDRLVEQREREWAQRHLQFLRQNASINIKDPTLSEIYLKFIKAQQAAATQAAAATTATAPAPTTIKAP